MAYPTALRAGACALGVNSGEKTRCINRLSGLPFSKKVSLRSRVGQILYLSHLRPQTMAVGPNHYPPLSKSGHMPKPSLTTRAGQVYQGSRPASVANCPDSGATKAGARFGAGLIWRLCLGIFCLACRTFAHHPAYSVVEPRYNTKVVAGFRH